MASIVCLCENVIRPHSFPNEGAYQLVSEVVYDDLPNLHLLGGRESAELLFRRGTEVHLCPNCGRLIVFLEKK
jgi:hypothetical protein